MMSRPINKLMNAILVLIFSVFSFHSPVGAQEIDDKQQAKIDRVTKMVDKAGGQFKSKDFKGSAKSIRTAQTLMLSIAKSGGDGVASAMRNDYDRLKKAMKLLVKQGQKFEELPSFSEVETLASQGSGSKGSDTKEGSDSKGSDSKGSGSKSTEMVSFTAHVAPIIVEHCGRCHIDQSRGRYSAATYAELKKGSRKGVAVKPNNIEKSVMISLIENGAMPPRSANNPVPPEKLQILKDWIDQGAKFDGERKAQKSNLKEFVSHGSNSKGSDSKGSDSKGSGSTLSSGVSTGGSGSGSRGSGSTRGGGVSTGGSGSSSKGSGSKGSGRR